MIFFILVMRVQKGFAIRCMRPATYIFLRNPEFDSLYDVPVSILDVNLNRFHDNGRNPRPFRQDEISGVCGR